MQVLDDIRESTRTAAIGFTKVLSQQIMRACSPQAAGNAQDMLFTGDVESSIPGASGSRRDRKRKRVHAACTHLEATTAVLIPILLDKGLVAASAEGRGFSLGLLVEIVKVNFCCSFVYIFSQSLVSIFLDF